MVCVLNVAEKPAVARGISEVLSRGSMRNYPQSRSRYNPNYSFDVEHQGEMWDMIVTSVTGHLKSLDFGDELRNWRSVDPYELFTAPVHLTIGSDSHKNVAENLRQLARRCDKIVLWLDCDREGEAIAFEVLDECRKTKRTIQPLRARFSSVTPGDILRAFQNLVSPNPCLRDAVLARQEIDLRIGAAFTRLQTLRLREAFPSLFPEKVMLSYGPCQFPTLGFVIDRFMEVENFVSEAFWTIDVVVAKDGVEAKLQWNRERVFDEYVASVFCEMCCEAPHARVIRLEQRPQQKPKPLPLNTVELQKLASRKLHLSSERTMTIAEALYNRGLISYPRTETDRFSSDINLRDLVREQTSHGEWGAFAQGLLDGGMDAPRQGRNDDRAHPPIHPVKLPKDNLDSDHARVYELVARHFLASCSRNAEGLQTTCTVELGTELFKAQGLMVIARNYLDVYKYETWQARQIPAFALGDEIRPLSVALRQGSTQAPGLLREDELIALMDKNGIGTDATIAGHIQNIQTRNYAVKENGVFRPTKLGLALYEGYSGVQFESDFHPTRPQLRALMEKDITVVSLGGRERSRQDVVRDCLVMMRSVYERSRAQWCRVEEAIQRHFGTQPGGASGAAQRLVSASGPRAIMPCPVRTCAGTLTLRCTRDGNRRFLGCTKYPRCRSSLHVPHFVADVEVLDAACGRCVPGPVRLLRVRMGPGRPPELAEPSCDLCIGCCAPLIGAIGSPQYSGYTRDMSDAQQIERRDAGDGALGGGILPALSAVEQARNPYFSTIKTGSGRRRNLVDVLRVGHPDPHRPVRLEFTA